MRPTGGRLARVDPPTPDLFYPVAAGEAASSQITRAQRICAGCGVRQDCLDFAMRTGEVHGVWGGTTPEERIRVRRKNMRLRRARRAWRAETPDVRAS